MVWWVITRPIVWFIVRPIQFIFGNRETPTAKQAAPAPEPFTATMPSIAEPNSTTSLTVKVDQLAKIKALLDNGTISQGEFDRMKSEVLAS